MDEIAFEYENLIVLFQKAVATLLFNKLGKASFSLRTSRRVVFKLLIISPSQKYESERAREKERERDEVRQK